MGNLSAFLVGCVNAIHALFFTACVRELMVHTPYCEELWIF